MADETGAGVLTSPDDNPTLRLLRDARGHLGLRRFDLAVEVATQAIRLDPKRSETYVIRAEALRKLNQSDRALADLTLAIRLAPDRPAPYVIRAEIYRGRCQHDHAIADATQAIFLDPNSAAAYSIRATSRLTIGDPQGAAADQEELFRIDPTRPVPDLQAGASTDDASPAVASGDERFRKKSGGHGRDDERALFADGKPADKTYRSRPVVSDEDAPEALGTASGYKPETAGRPIPRHRTARKGPQVSPVLGGVVLLGLIGGGALLLYRNRGPQDAKPKDTVGQAAGTTTAVKSEPGTRAGSPTTPVPSEVVHAVPAVAQASTGPSPEPVSSPPQVAGPSIRLQEVAQLGGSDKKVWWVDLDGAGTRAVTAEDRHLKLWDFRSGFQDLKPTVLCSNDASVSGIMTAAFLSGSENVVTGHWNGEVRVWDTRRRPPSIGKLVKKLPDLVPWIAVSPDGKLVATGVRKIGQVDLWRNEKGVLTHLAVIGAGTECRGAMFSPDSRVLAVGYMGETVLWDCGGSKPRSLRTIRHEPEPANDMSFSPDGGTLAIPLGTAIKLYSLKRESEPPVVLEDANAKPPRTVLCSKSGKALFSCGHDQAGGSLSVWDIGQGRATQTIEKAEGLDQCLTLSRDGTILVSGGRGGVIRVWRVLGENDPTGEPTGGSRFGATRSR